MLTNHFTVVIGLLFALACTSTGCSKSFHEKFKWNAEVFFTDPQVVELCEAIEADDIEEIDRLIASGVDINSTGKGNMTPLLWAFPDDHLQAFEKLMKHGADPNVVIDPQLIPPQNAFYPKDSVTQIVCRSEKQKYFDLVFENGGDPDFPGWFGDSPIFAVIQYGPYKKVRIEKLLQVGADIDRTSNNGSTAVMVATRWGGQYDIALQLLEAGADYQIYDRFAKLIHTVASEEKRALSSSETKQKKYWQLVKWLEDHGESIAAAKVDQARWKKWIEELGPEKSAKLFDQEIADRLQREAEQTVP